LEKVQTEAAKVGLAINPGKTKVMKIGKWHGTDRIVTEEVPIEEVEDFCYLGSVMSSNSSCDKEIKTRMGKANAVFGRLERIWKSNGCSIDTKVRLYESIVLSTLLYRAETWPITVIKWQETGGSASQMDEEDIACLVEE